MAVPKGFENKDSKSEKADGHKQSGSPTFDVLGLLSEAKNIEKAIQSTASQAIDGFKQLVSHADDKHTQKHAPDLKRGSLLHAENHDNHQRGVLLGRLTHNETRTHQNPSHLSAFLLKRLHENESQHQPADTHQAQAFRQPVQFEEQAQRGTQWQEANYNFRKVSADVVLEAAKPLAALAPGADLNPNLGVDEQKLKDMGLPFTRSVDRDMRPFLEHVVRPIVTRQPEKFHSQMSSDFHASNLPYGGFQHHSRTENNYYHADSHSQNQRLPYGGFQSHMPYYRRQS